MGKKNGEGSTAAIALLPSFQIFKEPPDVGEEEFADLRFLVERRADLRKRVL